MTYSRSAKVPRGGGSCREMVKMHKRGRENLEKKPLFFTGKLCYNIVHSKIAGGIAFTREFRMNFT